VVNAATGKNRVITADRTVRDGQIPVKGDAAAMAVIADRAGGNA
jgi:hypothetical protein